MKLGSNEPAAAFYKAAAYCLGLTVERSEAVSSEQKASIVTAKLVRDRHNLVICKFIPVYPSKTYSRAGAWCCMGLCSDSSRVSLRHKPPKRM